MKRWLGALVAAMLPLAATAADDAIDGKKLYEKHCAMCHGVNGEPTEYGKKLKPFPARNHRAIAKLVDRDELRRIITYGVAGTAMTPKKYQLDPLEIEAVIDYIQTFDYKPDLAHGKKRFREVCAQCHGIDGRAKTGVGAKNLRYSKLSLKEIVHTIRYGRPGTLMTSKRHQLSNKDIADIAYYVYSLRYQASPKKGAKLYARYCAKCHATPAKIRLIGNAARRLTVADLDDRLLDLRIRHGRHVDRAKRGGVDITQLSDDDVQDLIAYIREQTGGRTQQAKR